ncbi:MAG: hypothetical protein PHG95_04005 [Patescibacteria group bacterium]|nr:hypothetical protein [Patescibacteria group bacterium]
MLAISSCFTSCQKDELEGAQPIQLTLIENEVVHAEGALDSIIARVSDDITVIVTYNAIVDDSPCQTLSVYNEGNLVQVFLPETYDGDHPGIWNPENLTINKGSFDGGLLLDIRYSNHILLSTVTKTFFFKGSIVFEYELPIWSHCAGDASKKILKFRTFEEGDWIEKEY